MPGYVWIGCGTLGQRTLSPKEALHGLTPVRVIARTRAYTAYGLPVIQGRATGTETAGVFSFSSDQNVPASVKPAFLESSNS